MKSILSLKLHLFLIGLLFMLNSAKGQQRNTQLKIYGHLQYNYDGLKEKDANSYFSIGEQDFFVTSNLSDRISFLGETVVKYDKSTSSKFAPSVERAQLKFDYYKNHSLIIGKMHTPVNYWNDVYHHGRLFYPTIDRPTSFSYLVPIHSLGLRLQGQNLGRWNFGYDICASNSIASSDIMDSTLNKALTIAAHIKPAEGLRIGASYYNDYMSSNKPGSHAGHTAVNSEYAGFVNFELTCFSVAYFGEHIELLSESFYNKNRTDSSSIAENYSQFLYAGWRFKEKHVIYALFDYLDISEKERHTERDNVIKTGIGYKIDIIDNCVMKLQLERMESNDHLVHAHNNMRYDIRFQVAYGF